MTFLDPTAGLLAAGAAVPAILLLYFLKLRRRPLRVSSTLLWEQAAKDLQVNVPFRWLRASLLLALQLLAALLIAAAIARPVIPGEAPTADRLVLVIDNSASMSAPDTDHRAGASATSSTAPPATTRLDAAKRRALELADSLGRATTASGQRPAAMVIASAASARIVLPFSTVAADLRDAINSIGPTDQPGGVGPALALVDAARSAEAGVEALGGARQQVVLFTDATPADTRGLPVRTVSIPAAPPAAPIDNIGFVALSVRRDAEQPETVHAFARLINTGLAAVTLPVRITFDGAVAGVRSVEAPALGEASVSIDFARREGGTVVIALDRPDALEADNAAAAILGPVTTPAVLIVAPVSTTNPAQPAPARADDFLLGFLESLRPRSLRVVDPAAYHAEVRDARTSARPPWRDFNLIVFDRTEPAADAVPPQPSISFGAGLPLPGLALRAAPTDPRRLIRFDTWRRADPLMRYVGLDPIVIGPEPATIATDAATTDAARAVPARVDALATGPAGPLIAALTEPGVGPRRIVISFPLARSNWGPDTSFAIFMANAVDALTGRGESAAGRWFTSTEPALVHPAPGARTIEANGPARLRVDVLAADQPAAEAPAPPLSLGVLDRVGVYRLTGAQEPALAVNLLDEDESRLSSPASTPPQVRRATSGASAAGDTQGRREIWHWFVLAAIALSAVEWFLFAWRFRA